MFLSEKNLIAWLFLPLLLILSTGCWGGGADADSHLFEDHIQLSPTETILEIPFGEHRAFALSEGRTTAFSHQGISTSNGHEGSLEMVVRRLDDPPSSKTLTIQAPAEAGTHPFPASGPELSELSEIELISRGDGEGSIRIQLPVLLRKVTTDTLNLADIPESTQQPDILFFMVDTLRKDHVGTYGYQADTTPNIDGFAQVAVVFDNAIAQSPWTRPSIASMFTGLNANEHGVTDRDDAIPETADVLAERLKAAGYQTAAVITNGNVCDKFGFAQGFDEFHRAGGPQKVDGSNALHIAEEILRTQDPATPLFLYLHISDPHAPYIPPEGFLERWAPEADLELGSRDSLRDSRYGGGLTEKQVEDIIALYNGEVAFVDHLFGEFLNTVQTEGMYDSSAILLVSDHGEEFWEHGLWGHGSSLTSALIEVPFILKVPGQLTGVRTNRLAQHIDILPTFLALAGTPPATNLRGVNLVQQKLPDNTVAFSSVDKQGRIGMSVNTRRWKLVESQSEIFTKDCGALSLLDLNADHPEATNLVEDHPEIVKTLKRMIALEVTRSGILDSHMTVIDDELRSDLEALGYLE